jgi:hypothetical protein
MAKLPFVVEPRLKPVLDRVGNEDIGIFEIERRGYLSVQERNFVQQVEKSDDGTSAVIKLSRKISARFGIGLERAYSMAIASVSVADVDERDELQNLVDEEFADEISEMITSLSQMQAKSEMVQALCMLIHRIDADVTPNDLKEIHPELISELSKFYVDESNKSTEKIQQLQEKESAEVSVADIEKKPRKKTADG